MNLVANGSSFTIINNGGHTVLKFRETYGPAGTTLLDKGNCSIESCLKSLSENCLTVTIHGDWAICLSVPSQQVAGKLVQVSALNTHCAVAPSWV